MEHPVEGCLCLIVCSLKNNFLKSRLICLDSVMEQPVAGCLHSVVCSLENDFAKSRLICLDSVMEQPVGGVFTFGCEFTQK